MPSTLSPVVRIVDDDAAIRDGLSFLLEAEGWDVRAYPDAPSFLAADAPSIPGCLILDIRMPGMSGVQLQAEMNRRAYTLPIIFLTGIGDIDLAVHTLRSGAVNFLQKPVDSQRLIEAVAEAVTKSTSKSTVGKAEATALWRSLTEREGQIMRLVAAGVLNKHIGNRLGLSVRTVEGHRANALRKLGARSSAELNALLALVDAP